MINRTILTGRLTKDPDVKATQSGVSVANFTLAVNRTFTNKQGEREADFINCVAFRKQAENIGQYLNKGALVGVDGRIQTRTYQNDEGRTIYITEVICDNVQFLESKNQQSQQNQNQQNQNQQNQYQQSNNNQNQNNDYPSYYQQGQIAQPQNRASQGNVQNNSYEKPSIEDDSNLPF